MRVLTGSEMLGGRHSRAPAVRDYPAMGTVARAIYDALVARKGRPVDLSDIGGASGRRKRALTDLTDFYGCDIRKANRRRHDCIYILAGEWFGSHYSDYVNQAIDEAIAQGASA